MSLNPHNSSPKILMVEDSPEDFVTATRAFKQASLANPIYRCEDGDDALDFLYHRGAYTDVEEAPRPNVILLDLNLPGTDGREVLATLKQDENLKRIPVIILTTSTDPTDIRACYDAGANSYLQKPVDFAGFVEAIQRLKGYWLELSVLPNGDH